MGVDIRVPVGAMFTMLGVLLSLFGLLGDKAIYARTLGIDVNLDWGMVLLAFGIIMLILGLRSRRAQPGSGQQERTPERQGH